MLKILVVDDQRDILDFMFMCLSYHGFKVKTATSGTGLLSSIDSFEPDLIILDVMLGHENGRHICKEIKTGRYAHIPVILYSANPRMLYNSEECNANDVLEKPFEITDLIQKINSHASPVN